MTRPILTSYLQQTKTLHKIIITVKKSTRITETDIGIMRHVLTDEAIRQLHIIGAI